MPDSKTHKTQLAVLGGGPGGYVAAFQAADLGLDVTLIDQEERLGGVCLLRGCIPSKALLHAREVVADAREAKTFGVTFAEPEIDVDKLRKWKEGVTKRLTTGLAGLAKKRNVTVLRARGRFAGSETIELEPAGDGEDLPERVVFEKAIVATGSHSMVPGPFNLDDERVMRSREALDLPDVPERLLVVGGGYIGLELGQLYQGLGAKVTVVELLDALLSGTDPDLVKPLHAALSKQFEAIHLETRLDKLEAKKDGVHATWTKENEATTEVFDRVLIAVGRRPNSENLGLENTKAKVSDKGFIEVDERMRTADPNLYAVGDVVGGYMLAHKASYEGKVAARAAAGERDAAFDARAIPAVVFTDPEIATTGLTESQAQREGREVATASFPWAGNGRALTLLQSRGLTKLVADPETRRLLGAGIVGKHAGEMIAQPTLAIEMGARAEDLSLTIQTHPTLAETLAEAAEKLFGKAIHGG